MQRFTGFAGFIGQKPVSELGVVAVRVEQRIGSVRLGDLAEGYRFGQP
ncbi:hypothetical protein [Nocardia nova]|nr:hypothetical protein [Nocardia nova]